MEDQNKQGVRYYWCVNCGTHGDFGRYRKTRIFCRHCTYTDVCTYTDAEIEEDETLRNRTFSKR